MALNRGWIPRGRENEMLEPVSSSITVVKDEEERTPLFGRANSESLLIWKNWESLRSLFQPQPNVFLKVINDKSATKSGPLIAHKLSTEDIPNRHLEYILTWYSLSAFSLLMSFLKK